MSTSSKTLAALRACFEFFGFFMLGCLVVILGIAVYFWLEEPRRMAARSSNLYAGLTY